MKNIRYFYVFRHGETDWNRAERFQGHTDIPLNEEGRSQARALIQKLEPLGLEALLSSNLSRASETAQIIANHLKLTVHEHPGLREANLGQAEGMTRQEIEATFGAELVTAWRAHDPKQAICYPGGETIEQVIQRVFETLSHFARTQSYSKVGVATHGGVIRRIMQSLLPPGSEPVPIPNGVLYLLVFDSTTGLWSVGDLNA